MNELSKILQQRKLSASMSSPMSFRKQETNNFTIIQTMLKYRKKGTIPQSNLWVWQNWMPKPERAVMRKKITENFPPPKIDYN